MDKQQDSASSQLGKPPFFWKKHLGEMVLSPFIGVFFGAIFFAVTLPPSKASVTIPSALGEAVGHYMLQQKIIEERMQYAWKIPLCAWLTFAVGIASSVVLVQIAILRRRRELQVSAPGTVADFDRQVAWQEPRQWVLKLCQWLKSLATPDGQKRLTNFLVDFFCFKIMLVEILAPILYVAALVYFTWKGVDLSTRCIVRDMAGGVWAGLIYFLLEALLFRLAMENWLVHFSIHGVIRSIRERLCGKNT